MEKRTCKTYNIECADNIKVKVGTIEKNRTEVVYATAKTKITYNGEDDPLEQYTLAMKRFNKEMSAMVKENKFFTGTIIAAPNISENNLATKKYTKLEYILFLRVSEPTTMDKILPVVEPFLKDVFELMGKTLKEYGFLF